MQRILQAHLFHCTISKVNKRTGFNLTLPATGYLLAVYLLTRSRPSVGLKVLNNTTNGKIYKRITYHNLRARIESLVSAGLLQSELVTYKGRQVTRYSLTISGHNYLTELERLAKAAKFTLDS